MIVPLLLLALLPACALEPGDLLCRACGSSLFRGTAHVHGTVLSGPRVGNVSSAPSLGHGGTVHTLKRASTAASGGNAISGGASVAVAVYSEGTNLKLGRGVAPSLFPGFAQTRLSCSRCDATVGWHFSRQVGESRGSASGDAGGVESPAAAGGVEGGFREAEAASRGGVVPFAEEEVEGRLHHLSTLPCLIHPNPKGWWTFSFCHRRHVEQFHETTRWSMGSFEAQGKKKERLAPTRPGYYTSHFYVNGQHCDETGKGRATEVQFFCCSEAAPSGSGSGSGSGGGGAKGPHILDLEEPGGAGTCKYVLRVCVPALCADHPLARSLTGVFRARKAKLGPPLPPLPGGRAGEGAGGEGQGGDGGAVQQLAAEGAAAAGAGSSTASGGSGASAAAAAIPHRELVQPSAVYEEAAMPEAFYAAALSALVGAGEVLDIAGPGWGASGGPVQFR